MKWGIILYFVFMVVLTSILAVSTSGKEMQERHEVRGNTIHAERLFVYS